MPLWCQKSSFEGSEGDGLVVWDYHVILAQRGQPPPHASSAAKEEEHGGSWVWDLDTSLPWPCPAPLYAARALHWGHMHHLSQRYQRWAALGSTSLSPAPALVASVVVVAVAGEVPVWHSGGAACGYAHCDKHATPVYCCMYCRILLPLGRKLPPKIMSPKSHQQHLPSCLKA